GKDEDKVATAIAKVLDEDKTVKYENFVETGELLLKGIGDVHLDTVVCKLKNRYGVTIALQTPKIAYRETIKKTVSVEGKHKKQSGGAGQYGHVKITFSPSESDGLTFTQSVVGGEVPKGYYPAVEKGLLEAMEAGVLLGYPMVQLAADLTGGSYHDVDSNEISFKLAAKLAYKELTSAAPVLLEPIGVLNVSVPESMVGDVMGDLNKRRGRVTGWKPNESRPKYTIIEAEVPKAEMVDYVIALRAMTQGRGEFTYHFVRYEEVPAQIAQRVKPCQKDN
ncbi:MAG: elongation factor G, partial [Clostridia bacterium]|nr:elongation factor G [Clostridia bacterium]